MTNDTMSEETLTTGSGDDALSLEVLLIIIGVIIFVIIVVISAVLLRYWRKRALANFRKQKRGELGTSLERMDRLETVSMRNQSIDSTVL